MSLAERIAGRQIQGARASQEDSFYFTVLSDEPAHALLVLADGMGGAVGGAVASGIAIEAFVAVYRNSTSNIGDRLNDGLRAANEAIAARVEADSSLAGMGCTLVAVAITDDGVRWISVGDSPLWLLRDGRSQRLNDDHSMRPVLSRLVEVGEMTAAEAARDSRRNALRSALTGEPEIEIVDGPSDWVALRSDDRVLLASDGVQTLSEEEIAATFPADDPIAAVTEFLNLIESRNTPNQDNATVVLFDGAGRRHDDVEVASHDPPKRAPWPGLAVLALVMAAAAFSFFSFQSKNESGGTPVGTGKPNEAAPTAAIPIDPSVYNDEDDEARR